MKSEMQEQGVSERMASVAVSFAEALQCLVAFSDALRKVRPSGGAAAPTILLTGSGLELRFTGNEPAPATAHETVGKGKVLEAVPETVVTQQVQEPAPEAAVAEQVQEPAPEAAVAEQDTKSGWKQERPQNLVGPKRIAGEKQDPAILMARLAKIEQELKALRDSTAALHELQKTVANDSRSIETTLESHTAAIGSVRTALSQNEELVEGIVETLHMLHGISDSTDDMTDEAVA